jgi:hypothetical protein
VTDTGVAGPFFISIGDQEKLQTFLDVNPTIPKDQSFVDDYDFKAYKAAGFGKFSDVKPEVAKQVKMSAPSVNWWNYFTNVGKLSPIPKDMSFGEIPEGVLRLGGTFVIQGDDIVYRWSDRLPGDHPDIKEIVDIAAKSSAPVSV